jgi:protein-S-isoprenylcysteine O-methyltransferase Ste14
LVLFLEKTWYHIFSMAFHHHQKNIIHWVSYAPLIFFAILLGGVILHVNMPINFISAYIGWFIGAILMGVAPLLIILSQRVRHTLYVPIEEQTCENFNVGPYRITRHPTYLGLFMLLIGCSFLINSFPMLIMTCAIIPIFSLIIIPQEEQLLEEMCGDVYRDYKKKVRMWI